MALRGKCMLVVMLHLLWCANALAGNNLPLLNAWPADAADGDLAFSVRTIENAISAATRQVTDSLSIDHVAILCRHPHSGMLMAIEADSDTVALITADSLLNRCCDTAAGRNGLIVARVSIVDVPASLQRARHYLGKPYDDYYLPGDSALYCSELVQLSYVTPSGSTIFDTAPMNFADSSGRILPQWRSHYANRGLDVPQSLPGTNPAALLRHPACCPLYRLIAAPQSDNKSRIGR